MNRTLSNLMPALFLAVVMLAASALAVAAPRAWWSAPAGALLLVLAMIGIDLVRRRRSMPSPGVLIVAAAILAASALIAGSHLDRLAGMIPIFGSCAALPLILRRDEPRRSC